MGWKACEESYPQLFKVLNLELGRGRYDDLKIIVSQIRIGLDENSKKSIKKKAREAYLGEEKFI